MRLPQTKIQEAKQQTPLKLLGQRDPARVMEKMNSILDIEL